MKIGRVPLMKSQIKKLKPLLDRATKFNKPPYDKHGFILVGQVQIPDNVNGIEEPWLKVVMLTGDEAKDVTQFVLDNWEKEQSKPE